MSSDASWNGTASRSLGSIFTTLFMESAALRKYFFSPSATDYRELPVENAPGARESDRYLTVHSSMRQCRAPETSPDCNLVAARANTRSCVGVKSLMTPRKCVKISGCILSCHFYHYFS